MKTLKVLFIALGVFALSACSKEEIVPSCETFTKLKSAIVDYETKIALLKQQNLTISKSNSNNATKAINHNNQQIYSYSISLSKNRAEFNELVNKYPVQAMSCL